MSLLGLYGLNVSQLPYKWYCVVVKRSFNILVRNASHILLVHQHRRVSLLRCILL